MDQVDVYVLDQLCSVESAIRLPNPQRKMPSLTELAPAAAPIIDSVVHHDDAVLELVTEDGATVTTTEDHPF